MSKIPGIIPSQNFELVRNRIGTILATEFANQYALTNDSDLNITVTVGRSVPFNYTEMPVINVLISRGDLDNQNQGFSDNTVTYYIDCYARSRSSGNNGGDVLAENHVLKLLGVSRAILENQAYKTLDFTPGFISNRQVTNFTVVDPKNSQDSAVTMMGRMAFSVRMGETTALKEGDLIGDHVTQMKLGETEEGYTWSTDGGTPINTCQMLIDSLTEAQLNECILPSYDFSDSIVLLNLTEQQRVDLTDEFGDPLVALATADLQDEYNEAALLSNPTTEQFIEDNAPPPINTANPIKTGQTTSYAAGDDGDRQDGRLIDWYTLDFLNPFGNTDRFTDTLGGQDYANNVVIDWSTWNQVIGTVLGYTRALFISDLFNWANAVAYVRDNTFAGLSGWRLGNVREWERLIPFIQGESNAFTIPPFTGGQTFLTSTSYPRDPDQCMYINTPLFRSQNVSKDVTANVRGVRTFTWNGSELI